MDFREIVGEILQTETMAQQKRRLQMQHKAQVEREEAEKIRKLALAEAEQEKKHLKQAGVISPGKGVNKQSTSKINLKSKLTSGKKDKAKNRSVDNIEESP
jgi:hypothetical protein